jgi:DNA-binding XRE family transcriptional regulator
LHFANDTKSIEKLLIWPKSKVNRISIKWMTVVSVKQIKAGRALLGWSQSDLASASDVSEPTIARLESVDGELGGRVATAEKIRFALEKGGIQFINENGGGPGVRLKKPNRK